MLSANFMCFFEVGSHGRDRCQRNNSKIYYLRGDLHDVDRPEAQKYQNYWRKKQRNLKIQRWSQRIGRIQDLKYKDGETLSRKELDEKEIDVSKMSTQMERTKAKFERIQRIKVNEKAGVEHIVEKLEFFKVLP